MKHFYELALISYVTASPFLFLWFHKKVLRQKWDNDLTDIVTASAYITSNVLAGWMAYLVQEWTK